MALVGRGHDSLPALDAVDVPWETLGDRTQLRLAGMDAGHAADPTHAQGIQRIGSDAVVGVLLPNVLQFPVEDRSPQITTGFMPVDARLPGAVPAFLGADPEPLDDGAAPEHRQHHLFGDRQFFQLGGTKLEPSSTESALW